MTQSPPPPSPSPWAPPDPAWGWRSEEPPQPRESDTAVIPAVEAETAAIQVDPSQADTAAHPQVADRGAGSRGRQAGEPQPGDGTAPPLGPKPPVMLNPMPRPHRGQPGAYPNAGPHQPSPPPVAPPQSPVPYTSPAHTVQPAHAGPPQHTAPPQPAGPPPSAVGAAAHASTPPAPVAPQPHTAEPTAQISMSGRTVPPPAAPSPSTTGRAAHAGQAPHPAPHAGLQAPAGPQPYVGPPPAAPWGTPQASPTRGGPGQPIQGPGQLSQPPQGATSLANGYGPGVPQAAAPPLTAPHPGQPMPAPPPGFAAPPQGFTAPPAQASASGQPPDTRQATATKGWWRRNIWGLVALLPVLALALGPSVKEGLDRYNRADAHEAIQPGPDGWASYSDVRMRLDIFEQARDLKTRDGQPFQPPARTKVWMATITVDAGDKWATDKYVVAGCNLELEDTQGRQFTANPTELSGAERARWIASCSPSDDETPTPWQVEIFFVLPESAQPAALRISRITELPRYIRFPVS